MQEFFRRFFGQPMPGAPRQGAAPEPARSSRRKKSARAAWAPASS